MELIRKWISNQKPIAFENSRIPKLVSYVSPIEPFAVSFGPFIFCKSTFPDRTLRHETIHYHQQLELLFVFHWILYLVFHVKGMLTEKNGAQAYRQNPFELEAYDNDDDIDYLASRGMYSWVSYLKYRNI